MATELAAAYVTIIPSLTGAGKTIEKALGGVNVTAAGNKIGSNLGSKIASGIGSAIGMIGKTALGAIAGIGAAAVGTAISGGISRAIKLDNAQMKFEAMGMDVTAMLESCNEAVTGTAYGLDAAATVAASLGASGVQAGEDMTKALKMTAGLAAMSGRSMEDIGLIVGKVAAQGVMQGDELMQLAESGVAVLPALAQYLGVTNQEAKKLISEGVIDFKIFSEAMYATFGEAAQGANETFTGAMSNVRAALSRIGAKFATPGLESLRRIFVALIPAINAVSKLFDPLVEKFTAFSTATTDRVVAGIEKFTEVLNNSGSFVQAFMAGIRESLDGTAFGSFISFVTGLAKLFTMAETPAKVFELVLSALKLKFESFGLGGKFTAFMDSVREKIANLPQPVQDVIGKITEFFSSINLGGAAALGGFALILGKFGAPLTKLVTNLGKVGATAAGFFGKIRSYGGVLAFLGTKFNTFRSAIALCGGGFKGLLTVLGGAISPVTIVVGAIAALAAAFVYLMSTNEGFRNTIMGLVSSIGQSLAPVITTIVGTVTELAARLVPLITNLVSQLVPVLGQIITVILQVVAALAPVVATIVGVVIPIIADVIALVVEVAAQILSAVMPVVTAILDVIQMAMPIIQSVITAAMNAIKMCIDMVWPAIRQVIESVMRVIQAVISTVCALITGNWEGVWQGICDFVSGIWDAISGLVSAAINFVLGIIGGVLAAIRSIWNDVWGWVSSFIGDTWNNVCEAVSNGVDSAIEFVSGLPDAVIGFFSNAGDWLVDAGKNILQGLWNGLVAAKDWLIDKVKGIADWIIDNKGPKSYDLKMLVPNGQWIMSSLCSGIESGMPKLQGTLSGVSSQIEDWSAKIQPYQDVDANVRTWSNARIVTSDEREADRMGRYEQALKQLGDRIEGMRVVMDSGELVGATAGKYDRALSRRQMIAERGF